MCVCARVKGGGGEGQRNAPQPKSGPHFLQKERVSTRDGGGGGREVSSPKTKGKTRASPILLYCYYKGIKMAGPRAGRVNEHARGGGGSTLDETHHRAPECTPRTRHETISLRKRMNKNEKETGGTCLSFLRGGRPTPCCHTSASATNKGAYSQGE